MEIDICVYSSFMRVQGVGFRVYIILRQRSIEWEFPIYTPTDQGPPDCTPIFKSSYVQLVKEVCLRRGATGADERLIGKVACTVLSSLDQRPRFRVLNLP